MATFISQRSIYENPVLATWFTRGRYTIQQNKTRHESIKQKTCSSIWWKLQERGWTLNTGGSPRLRALQSWHHSHETVMYLHHQLFLIAGQAKLIHFISRHLLKSVLEKVPNKQSYWKIMLFLITTGWEKSSFTASWSKLKHAPKHQNSKLSRSIHTSLSCHQYMILQSIHTNTPSNTSNIAQSTVPSTHPPFHTRSIFPYRPQHSPKH